MALDEASAAIWRARVEAGVKPAHELGPAEFRRRIAAALDPSAEKPAMAATRDVTIPATHGEVKARLHVPASQIAGLIVYGHGGGWVLDTIEGHDALVRRLAEASGCAILLVDYRAAPEHPYPAALEDMWAAVEWAAEGGADLPGGRLPLIVAGDSAGGNLAAVCAHRARDRGGPAVAMQVLLYPVTDADFERTSFHEPDNQLILCRNSMMWFWDQYVPDPARRAETEASPSLAGDFAGLAPAIVVTAEHDVLRDEGEAYADALRDAGVPVRHRRFAGQMHGFATMFDAVPASFDLVDFVAGAIRAELAGG